MGGKNPYIEETKYTPATKKYKITFVKEGKTIEIDPDKIPYGHDGLPGSLLDISQGFHMGLDHACGGVCACSTCHVIVHEGLDSCNEATDAEYDQLDEVASRMPVRAGRNERYRRRDSRVEQELRERGGPLIVRWNSMEPEDNRHAADIWMG
jgi:2Fe-2S ferredoxin